MNNGYIYFVQFLFATGIAIGSQTLNEEKHKWLNVTRYAFYVLTIIAVPEGLKVYQNVKSRIEERPFVLAALEKAISHLIVHVACGATLIYFGESLFDQDFVFVFFAYLIVKYLEMSSLLPPPPPEPVPPPKTGSINYGVGMACSYFEGYLVHMLPSDGAKFVGFEENMRVLEDKEGVLFPVKKLFIIVAKNLFSPPDLKEFNRGTDGAFLESFNILPEIRKSVAGVRDRSYHNTAYKIYRPGAPPVCLAAECATPIHTLYNVLNKRALYAELADIDVDAVVSDFLRTLRAVLDKSLQCRGKCELVFYDPEDPTQNLADVLLDRIRELEPNFERKILARREQNRIHDE